MIEREWNGCYDESWKSVATEESTTHPAKYARGLIRRIYQHLRDHYQLPPGSVVVDPFGGVANGALDAMEMGYAWLGCELEERFVEIGRKNIAHWKRFWPDAQAELVQGDSRELCSVLGPVMAGVVVSSPPYSEGLSKEHTYSDQTKREAGTRRNIYSEKGITDPFYGTEPGNLGNMKPGSVEAVVSSPPYARIVGQGETVDEDKIRERERRHLERHPELVGKRPAYTGYGNSEGQLGQMPAGSVSAVVSSPPFLDAPTGGGIMRDGVKRSDGQYRGPDAQPGNRSYTPSVQGTTEGQLSSMPPGEVSAIVGSPPFLGQVDGGGIKRIGLDIEGQSGAALKPGDRTYSLDNTGQTTGNLAAMPEGKLADSIVTSPPFADSVSGRGNDAVSQQHGLGQDYDERQPFEKRGFLNDDYEAYAATCNLGNFRECSPTFWSESAKILQQCYAILKPGGIAVFVTKDFVRKGQRVTFSEDWLKLCTHTGFEPVEWIKASLVKQDRHPGLFGEDVVKQTERKSFFRRLAEKKGSPRIDHEDVLIVRKPHHPI